MVYSRLLFVGIPTRTEQICITPRTNYEAVGGLYYFQVVRDFMLPQFYDSVIPAYSDFVSAQYLENKLMKLDQMVHMD